MTAFFVRTDAGASGPFTGVELREAALASLLTPETVISDQPTGPWTPAFEAGLFSDKRVPLPHPAGVKIPLYHVSGLSENFRGPFKLRELIGFAARGLLPADAKLRADIHTSWVPVTRIHILAATLRGDLALMDGNGKVIRRAIKATGLANQGDVQAPVMFAPAAVHLPSEALLLQANASTSSKAQPDSVTKPPATLPSDQSNASPTQPSETILSRARGRIRLPEFDLSLAVVKRVAAAFVLVVIVASAGYAVTHRRPTTLAREMAVGDWLVPSGSSGEYACGLALRPDGRCIVFNAGAACWTGRYRWLERTDDTRGLRGLDTTIELDQALPQHAVEPVGATDGYLRFVGEGDSLPMIDGHQVSDAFVQKAGEQLRMGYPVSMSITTDHKQLLAGWIVLHKDVRPARTPSFEGISLDQLPKPAELLAMHGIPDEARPIQRHEVPRDRITDSYIDAQVIRYDDFRFAMTNTDAWQPVTSSVSAKPMDQPVRGDQ
jgi:hypothetical protein